MGERSNDNVILLLKNKGLSVTYSRKLLLETFLATNVAVSQLKLCKIFNGQLDKATIYRTLRLFVKKKLLYVVPTTDLSIAYAFYADQSASTLNGHSHFICEKCNKTFYLNGVNIPPISLPPHLNVTRSETFIYGICNECKKSRQSKLINP
ncbi:hypothetical protein A8C56_18665 [Niabella ginsenosidivorans]|uniref:Fur family transcriptional regulator n=1 Tax=Niabella ginsenosidivorans TaxID=1176587 RepID=A0A1A9I4X6_9BACT|nr:transcriptional repressor [Niabella ginsenosidivorans]ANH82728.1 hypothetical protein A8C56_18665 [Niabella ginsenosidivorans]